MLRSWVMGEAGKEAGTRDVQPVRRSFWRCYRRRSDFLGFRYGVTVERLLEVVGDVKPDRQKERKGVVREKRWLLGICGWRGFASGWFEFEETSKTGLACEGAVHCSPTSLPVIGQRHP